MSVDPDLGQMAYPTETGSHVVTDDEFEKVASRIGLPLIMGRRGSMTISGRAGTSVLSITPVPQSARLESGDLTFTALISVAKSRHWPRLSPEQFGHLLDTLGLTGTEAAAQLSALTGRRYTPNDISRWRSGRRRVPYPVMAEIANLRRT